MGIEIYINKRYNIYIKDGDIMSTQSELERLLNDGRHNEKLKNILIETTKAKDPMKEFCAACLKNGYEIYLGELFALGEDMNDSKLRSVNGGGVTGIDGWDDAYETFFAALNG